MDSQEDINRREFVAGTIAIGAAAALPILENKAYAEDTSPPRERPDGTGLIPQNLRVQLKVNGKTFFLDIDSRETLLDVLRHRLLLTGTKKACDHGQCGACTVLANGMRVNSCLCLAAQYQNKDITTIEGIANGDTLHPMQEAFIRHDALQCGFCTPGQIMSAIGLGNEKCGNSEVEIRESMSGNLCRCGAYRNILSAVEEVHAKNLPKNLEKRNGKKGSKHANV